MGLRFEVRKFQTPAERIYTPRQPKFPCRFAVSNSSGGNLHDKIQIDLSLDAMFQTPTEKISTQNERREIYEVVVSNSNGENLHQNLF